MVLELGRQVDAVVLADVSDSLRWQLPDIGADTHSIEDRTSSGQITAESTRADIGQASQRTLADIAVLIVIVDHSERLEFRD